MIHPSNFKCIVQMNKINWYAAIVQIELKSDFIETKSVFKLGSDLRTEVYSGRMHL